MTICIGKVRIKSKMKNTNNNYLNLTAYCVEWSQNVKWIELDHSRNRIVSRIVCRYKMNKMSTEFFQFFFFTDVLATNQTIIFWLFTTFSHFFLSKFSFVCTAHVLYLVAIGIAT